MLRDPAYLLDILIAARMVRKFSDGLSWEEFVASDLHQQAVMREIEIIGEAASKISRPVRDAHPEIPWQSIIGMRNRLVHEDFRIDLPTVWKIVQE